MDASYLRWYVPSDILGGHICDYGSMKFQSLWWVLNCAMTQFPVAYLSLAKCHREVSCLTCKGIFNRFSVMVKKIVLRICLMGGLPFSLATLSRDLEHLTLKAIEVFFFKSMFKDHMYVCCTPFYFASSVVLKFLLTLLWPLWKLLR